LNLHAPAGTGGTEFTESLISMGTLVANTSHFVLVKMAHSFVDIPNMTKISILSSC
jgi:hypothetical protein